MTADSTARKVFGGPRGQKAIVVSDAPRDALTSFVAALALPRRALSWPVDGESSPTLPSFVELWGAEAVLRATIDRWPFAGRAWLVEEFVPVAYARTWPSGERSPGLRMVSTLHRRADLSRAEFEAHWRGPHVAVATSYTVPVWHYVQNVVREALGHDSDVDGFVAMHFRTEADLRARWRDHREEAARGAEDARRFMAVERSTSATMVEILWEGRGGAGR